MKSIIAHLRDGTSPIRKLRHVRRRGCFGFDRIRVRSLKQNVTGLQLLESPRARLRIWRRRVLRVHLDWDCGKRYQGVSMIVYGTINRSNDSKDSSKDITKKYHCSWCLTCANYPLLPSLVCHVYCAACSSFGMLWALPLLQPWPRS